MPMTWNAEADAKLLLAVIKVYKVRPSGPKLEEVARIMGCSACAVGHRFGKLKMIAGGVESTPTGKPTAAGPSTTATPTDKSKIKASASKSAASGSRSTASPLNKGRGGNHRNTHSDYDNDDDDDDDDEEEEDGTKLKTPKDSDGLFNGGEDDDDNDDELAILSVNDISTSKSAGTSAHRSHAGRSATKRQYVSFINDDDDDDDDDSNKEEENNKDGETYDNSAIPFKKPKREQKDVRESFSGFRDLDDDVV